MEDLALSLRVKKRAKLFNARTAKIFHDTQPGFQKDNKMVMSEMELVNRYYVMRYVADFRGWKPYAKLFLQQLYYATITKNIFNTAFLKGKWKAIKIIRKFK